MNSLVAYIQPYLINIYIQPYYSQVVKKIFNIVVVCEEKKIAGRKRKKIIFFIILLNNLYYFTELYIKIKIEIYSKL